MTNGHMSTKEITLRDPQKALGEIKDTAILLNVAGEYLCEEAFLKKMGFVLNHNVEILKKHVSDLRSQFVGKPVRDVELGPRLEEINRIADLFQKIDDTTKQRCVAGELGRELSDKYASLTAGIHQLKGMIVGTAVSYTKADSMKGFFGKLRFLLVSLAVTYKIGSRIVGILILVCALPSGWLADRIGRKRLVAYSGLGAAMGTLVLVLAPNMTAIYVGGCIVGAATGTFFTTNWALGTDVVPKEEAGHYLGISNLAGAGAGAVGAYIGGPIADYFTVYAPQTPGLGYLLVFAIYAVLFLVSALVTLGIQES